MSDQFDGQKKYNGEKLEGIYSPGVSEWEHLEEIGDLHFHAAAYSCALDYYQQLLDNDVLYRLPRQNALDLLRKSIIAGLGQGRHRMVEKLLDRADTLLNSVDQLPEEELIVHKALFMRRRAALLMQQNQYLQALELAKHSFTILALTDEHSEVATCQVSMGICHHRLGNMEKAEEFYGDALATFRRVGDEQGIAESFNNLAILRANECQWPDALDLMDRSIELNQRLGVSFDLAANFLNKGIILTKIARLDEARTYLEKSRRMARSLGDQGKQARVCIALGNLEIKSERLSRAEELLLEGKMIADQCGYTRESTLADEFLGDILLARGELDKALFNYGLGLERSRELGRANDLEGELLRRTCEAQRRQGRLNEALATGQAAIAVCEKCGEVYELGFCHISLGLIYAAQQDWQPCDAHFREAIAIFKRQNLGQDEHNAIITFLETRIDTAGRPELLLLRRYLMEAQERNVAAIDDLMLCRLLLGLAKVQIRLRQFDDALLTVFELERNAKGIGGPELVEDIVRIRDEVETGLLGGIEKNQTPLVAISGIPGIFNRRENAVPRNLSSVLQACMERVQADSGFIAMFDSRQGDGAPRVVAREGMIENLGQQLAQWFISIGGADAADTCLFSRLDDDADLLQAVPALRGQVGSCVFLPIAMHDHLFGVLFIGMKTRARPGRGFKTSTIDFLSTYMGFLALFLVEKNRDQLAGAERRAATPIEGVESFQNIITQNEQMLDVLRLVRKVAPSDLTVLLNGETGTGKGLLAYALHALSHRQNRKFLSINCAAIPESLLESELFGHLRGSFTGAHGDKKGLLAEAEGGTVFLDEIGKMPLGMQGKLLHFIDTKVIRPVGSTQEHQVDVRIVCASKTDLRELSATGGFLEDLYYRLLDFPLEVPPLRKRRDDISLLARHFVERFSQDLGIDMPGIGAVFMEVLMRHDWPGNIRELEKCLKRAIVLAHGESVLGPAHLPLTLQPEFTAADGTGVIPPLKETLAAIECREISQAMKLCRGNKSKAARALKISYPNLLKKIRHYGISHDS